VGEAAAVTPAASHDGFGEVAVADGPAPHEEKSMGLGW
jgi:hypothetical protein